MKHLLRIVLVLSIFACSKEDTLELTPKSNETTTKKATLTAVKVSSQSGANNYAKLVAAVAKANSTNEIVIDVNVTFNSANKAIVIDKNGVTLRGATRTSGKFKLTRAGAYKNKGHILNSLLVVKANNVTVNNLQFFINSNKGYRCVFAGSINASGNIDNRLKLYSDIDFLNCAFKQQVKTDGSRGLFFEGSFKNVLIKNCYYNNWFGLVARDCPNLINFTVDNNTFANGDHQISFDGALLGEKDPTYGIGVNLVNHSNIKVINNTFNICQKFNLAIANTRNVLVQGNTMNGGTGGYSQPVHIEDGSKNITIVNNVITSPADCAILVFSTGKVGHGQGRKFTEAEKKAKGSGNIIIKNNTINSLTPAVESTYLNGYIRFEGNNVIQSNNSVAVKVINSNVGAKVIFKDNNSTFKGSKFAAALTNGKITVDKNITIVRP